MEIQYLQSLLSKPQCEWQLDLDLSTITDKSSAISLWNLTIKLSEIASISIPIQKNLSKFREKSCQVLENFFPKSEIDKYWLRTSKSFIDCEEFEQAEQCLNKIEIDKCKNIEIKFNFYLWKTNILFLLEKEYFFGLKECLSLIKELPNERFRLARFLYSEMCKKLVEKRKFYEIVDVLFACQEICQGCSSEPLKKIYEESKLLLVESLIEVNKFEKAMLLLQELKISVKVMLLYFKFYVYTDNFEEIQKCFTKLFAENDLNAMQIAVEILVSKNNLVDASKCLYLMSQKYKSYEILLKWFKILFVLDNVNGIDPSIEYLSIKKVISLISTLKSNGSEYKELLWNYIQEIFAKKEINLALEYAEKYFLPIAEGEEIEKIYIFIGNCYLEINQPINCLNIIKSVENTSEGLSLLIRAKIKIGEISKIDSETVKKLPCHEIIKILQELLDRNYFEFYDFVSELCDVFMKNIENIEDKIAILQWYCENEKNNIKSLKKYLNLVLEIPISLSLEYFYQKAWNSALEIEENREKIELMMISLRIIEKQNSLATTNGLNILINTSKFVISEKFSFFYEEIYNFLKITPEYMKNQEIMLMEFELILLLKLNQEIVFPNDLITLKRMADICILQNDTKFIRILLHKCLEIQKDCETIRELIKISKNFDEAEAYLQIAFDIYDENTNIDEKDWIIAVCWNNGTRLINNFQYCNARKWMHYAILFAEKFNSILAIKMKGVYQDLSEINSSD